MSVLIAIPTMMSNTIITMCLDLESPVVPFKAMVCNGKDYKYWLFSHPTIPAMDHLLMWSQSFD